ncbi:MAG: O-antigen ligase family protein [Candidatus Binatus sp.]
MRTKLINLTDRAVIGGLVLLILVTPLCFGTVHPWAYRTAETAVFAMLAATFLRMRAAQPAIKGAAAVLSIAAPAAVLVLLISFQLAPLPPSLLHVLSPGAYDFYQHALDGWPKTVDYARPKAQPAQSANSETRMVVLPTESEVKSGAPVPFTSKRGSGGAVSPPVVGRSPADPGWYGTVWRPLSLAPPLGIASAPQLFAAFGLFVIVALYPVTPEATPRDEDPLTRLLVTVILISGFVVAVIGLAQQVTWNGKVLWFFVPLDWGAPNPNPPRMMGPFVDPDHFAAYLAMTLPLFISQGWGALAADGARERDETVPILCSAGLVVLVCAILLSESRAIWAGAVLSCVLFAMLASRIRTPTVFRARAHGARAWVPRLLLAALAVAALSMALIGSAGRGQVDTRVGQSVGSEVDFWFRVHIWRDTLRMVRDYALLGVGFGSWPEMFPHYQTGPWPVQFLRNAHNDYIQTAAELGILGGAAFAMIVWRIARVISKRWNRVSPRAQLTLAALVAGMSVEGFHELFDFSLTTAAIGFLFTIYAALLVRIAVAGAPETESAIRARLFVRGAGPYAAAAAVILAVASTLQGSVVYPYYPPPRTFDAARTMVLLHPANAGLHLALASWYGNSPIGLAEISRAVWIDPRNPFARDLYASSLADDGRIAQALNQITISVMRAPSSSSHIYLNPRVMPYLATPDRGAIEQGLLEATARGYSEAIGSLGSFYLSTGRSLEAAQVYERGAASEQDPNRRAQLLMGAGQTYASAGQLDHARHCFEEVRDFRPEDPEPYSALLTEVFAVRKDTSGAESVLREGLDAGVDPVPLYAAFAQVAEASGQPDKERAALVKVVEYEPTYDNLLRLGSFYLGARDYERASQTFRRATEVDPTKPRAWVELAVAEDGAYEYVAADRDYLHARALAPNDIEVRDSYAAFQKKLAAGRAQSGTAAMGAGSADKLP